MQWTQAYDIFYRRFAAFGTTAAALLLGYTNFFESKASRYIIAGTGIALSLPMILPIVTIAYKPNITVGAENATNSD